MLLYYPTRSSTLNQSGTTRGERERKKSRRRDTKVIETVIFRTSVQARKEKRKKRTRRKEKKRSGERRREREREFYQRPYCSLVERGD